MLFNIQLFWKSELKYVGIKIYRYIETDMHLEYVF